MKWKTPVMNLWPVSNRMMGEIGVGVEGGREPLTIICHVCASPWDWRFIWNQATPSACFLSAFCVPAHSYNLPSRNLRIIESLVGREKLSREPGLPALAWSISTSGRKMRQSQCAVCSSTQARRLGWIWKVIQGLPFSPSPFISVPPFPPFTHLPIHPSLHPPS